LEVEEKVVIDIVYWRGWALYNVLLTDSAEDLDRPRYTQVYLHFKDLPLHIPRLSHELLDDEAIPWVGGGKSGYGIDFCLDRICV